MPNYLRFVKGVVDSQDLPLNVSREILQGDRDIQKIKASSVKRVLDELKRLANKEADSYQGFWSEFGQALKEGVVEDHTNKDKITPLLRFSSTNNDSDEQTVSLDDYVGIRTRSITSPQTVTKRLKARPIWRCLVKKASKCYC